jgi:hypothetical protein
MMDLSKILSISGKPGLYKMVGEAKNNLIVESLTDGKRGPAFPHERISSLQEISIYTETDDASLEDVLKNLHEIQEGKPAPNPKKASSKELKELFEKALPDYDKDAVYVSDIKKVFNWYNTLLAKDLLDFSEEDMEEPGNDEEAETKLNDSTDEKDDTKKEAEEKA